MNLLKRSDYHNQKSVRILPYLLLLVLFSSFAGEPDQQDNDDEFVVVLDAGHGGHDPGNLGNGYLEKNIALNIVLKVGAILERTPGLKVVYTRKDDTFVDLYVRGEIANKANADLFVSVHCDSHSSNAYGAGTFVLGLHANKQNFEIAKKENSVIYLEDNYETRYADYDINSPESVIGLTIMQEEFLDQSISLAKNIQNNFSEKLKRKDREVKQAGFIVLHQTFMPSVLVETGFLTNDKEGAYLNSNKGQTEMGTAIAEAIVSYRTGFQSGIAQLGGQTNTPTPEPADQPYDPFAVAKEAQTDKKAVAETLEEAVDKGETPTMNEMVSSDLDSEKRAEEKKEEPPVNALPQTSEVVTVVNDEVDTSEKEVPIAQEVILAGEQSKPSEVIKAVADESEAVLNEQPKAKEALDDTAKPTGTELRNDEKNEAIVEKTKENTNNIIFKVQLMASTKNIPLEPTNFNGLDTLSKETFKQFQRYMYGNTGSFAGAQALKSKADASGYPSAFIVAYKDGVRIPTPDAIKLAPE